MYALWLGDGSNKQPADAKDDTEGNQLLSGPPLDEFTTRDCHANDGYAKPNDGLHFWCAHVSYKVF